MAHKYKACPTVIDNIRFASKAEAKRYGELKLLEKAGEIGRVDLQPSFSLRVPLPGSGYAEIGTYRGDFVYWRGGKRIVEDVKGFKTPLYRWKKKHVEAQYGITITEVTRR